MADDPFVSFAADQPAADAPSHRDTAPWGIAAISAFGAFLAISAVIDLVLAPGRGFVGFDGIYFVRLALGLGLTVRKQLARLFMIYLTGLALIATVASGGGDYIPVRNTDAAGIFALLLSIALDVAILVILTRPSVARNYD
jgi:hypothetical protein